MLSNVLRVSLIAILLFIGWGVDGSSFFNVLIITGMIEGVWLIAKEGGGNMDFTFIALFSVLGFPVALIILAFILPESIARDIADTYNNLTAHINFFLS